MLVLSSLVLHAVAELFVPVLDDLDRRLFDLSGSAVWAFRLEGVVHEHQTVPGVAEDIHQIIRNLKALTIIVAPDVEGTVLHLKTNKAGQVKAKDLEPHGSVSIVDPDHVLFTLQEDREILGELYVNKGRGYVEASEHPADRSLPVDLVRIDALYNPVQRANFTVAETRVGQRTDFDSVTLSVETDGAVSPEDAVAYAAALLEEHLHHFIDFGQVPAAPNGGDGSSGADTAALRDLLSKSIDDCGLSVRSINSLKNSSISTLGDLVKYSEDDLLKVKNVGDKALKEIMAMLGREGLSFGMTVDEQADELAVSDSAPAGIGDGEVKA